MKPDISIIPEREKIETPSRRKLTKWEVADLMRQQGGQCALCRVKLYVGAFDEDHIIPLACGGTNAFSNFQLLCRPCHRDKTNAEDKGNAAKIKRMAGITGQRARRERNGPKVKGRGFPKNVTKKFNGEVVRKEQ